MGVNNYQTILRIELNDRMCYSEHHLMVPAHFDCWVAGSFKHYAHKQATSNLIHLGLRINQALSFATLHSVSDCLGRLATASESTSSSFQKGSHFSDMGPWACLVLYKKAPSNFSDMGP